MLLVAPLLARDLRPDHHRGSATFLPGLFRDTYPEYETNVPAFLPRLTPWQAAGAGRSGGFSFPLYLRHNEWQAGLGFLVVLGWLVFSPFR
ncbi:MAG: hypothetical protein U5K74_03500 [Gemmatimonadaceae bacterium]|nr:hypothetical protein [Gemmatimonadaceae bacterium]